MTDIYLYPVSAGNDVTLRDPVALQTGDPPAPVRVSKTLTASYAILRAPERVALSLVVQYRILSGVFMAFTPSPHRTLKPSLNPKAFTGGAFWSFTSTGPSGIKDADETIDITFDWTEILADIKDAIANATFTVAGVINAGSSTVGGLSSVFVSGGGVGINKISCKIVTASFPARTFERTCYLIIAEL